LGEEAQKLAEAVHEWINGVNARTGGAGEPSGPRGESPECRVCPVCHLLRVVRTADPEVFGHLADAAASVSAAVRTLLASEGGQPPAGPPRRGGVEHIDLG
jgi:hypothetical protein